MNIPPPPHGDEIPAQQVIKESIKWFSKNEDKSEDKGVDKASSLKRK
jgi:hypothetical protein